MPIKNLFEKSRKEKERKAKKETAKKVVVGTAIGTAVGAVSGLLFAPKSGKETRDDIARKTKETTDAVKVTIKDSAQVLMEKGEKIGKNIKDKIEEVKSKKENNCCVEEYSEDDCCEDECCEEESNK